MAEGSSSPQKREGVMIFKFDNPIGSWMRSVWWRKSQQQQGESILLGSLPPVKEINMSSMSYHKGLACISRFERPLVFNPTLRRSCIELPRVPPAPEAFTLTRRLTFLGSTATAFKVLSVAETFGGSGYRFNMMTVGQGVNQGWEPVRNDLPRHEPARAAKSVCIDNCIYYEAYLNDSGEAVLVKVDIQVGVVSCIKLPHELTVNLTRMGNKPSESAFSWNSTVLGVYRGRLTLGINSRFQHSTVLFSMESPTSWVKETILTDLFEEGVDFFVQTYLRGFSSCGENIIFTMHEVCMDGAGYEDRLFGRAQAHVVYYNAMTGEFDRESIEAVNFPASETTGSDTVVWNYTESNVWLQKKVT